MHQRKEAPRLRLNAAALTLLLIALVGVGVLAGWLLFDDGDSDSGAGAGDLFAQTAQGGSFVKRGDGYTLTLRDVSPTTTLFTDRPERRSDAIATEDFVAAYADLFGDDPPNATLSSVEAGRDDFTVELLRPRYDVRTRSLAYAARPIGAEGTGLPDRFGSASLFIDSGAEAVATSGYTCTPGSDSGAWVCTFNDSGYQVAVGDLVDQLSGVDADSAFCLQAWGGAGGNGSNSGGPTGHGGDGGYARTIVHLDEGDTIGYLIGQSGGHPSDAPAPGGGGSSTIVGTGTIDASSASTAAATNQQFADGALLIAAGGGGGSHGDRIQISHDGGDGGTAIAMASGDVHGAGGGGHGNHGGGGGDNGDGGSGFKGVEEGKSGFGGQGGNTGYIIGPGGWPALPKSAYVVDGAGGNTASGGIYSGGSGGGGYGGGAAGETTQTHPAGGGGGGGSLAKQADVGDGPAECTDPPSLEAAFRMVIYNP